MIELVFLDPPGRRLHEKFRVIIFVGKECVERARRSHPSWQFSRRRQQLLSVAETASPS